MVDFGEPRYHLLEAARRQHQRIAAGQDHFPDFWRSPDVIERGRKRCARQPSPPRADHFAPKAETAIDRAGVDDFQQDAIGVAVDHTFDRAVRIVANRIGTFVRMQLKLLFIGNELPRHWIVRI